MKIEKIAQGLSEVQQNMLLYFPKGHFGERTRRCLIQKGLLLGFELTPLGLVVRDYLKGHGHDN